MGSVIVAASPSSAELLFDDILPTSNFERAKGSTPFGAITVFGPEGKKYVLFDLDSHAVFPKHALDLNGPSGHEHLGPGFPSGLGGMLHDGRGWSAGDGDVATGWKFGHDASGGDGGGNGSGGGSGASSPSAGGDGGGAGGSGGGRKGGNTSGLTSSTFSGDAVTTDSAGWVGGAAAQVPEPATSSLLAAAFGLLTATARRRGGQRS